jgi:hypothetical protein
MNATEKRQLDNELMRMGLGKLNDPNLILQIAMLCQGHEHLMEMIQACDVDKRTEMYEAMRSHLRFEALPLDQYLRYRKGIVWPKLRKKEVGRA